MDEDDELEPIREEQQIIRERSAPAKEVSAEMFELPLDVLCTRPAATVDVDTTIGEAARIMRDRRFGSLLVVERGGRGRLAGIVTERDFLLKVIAAEADLLSAPVSRIMTPDPETLRRNDSIAFVMHKMHVGGYRHVPIVDDEGHPEHVISIKDVMAFVLSYFPERILNIPPEPFRGERRVESE